MTTDEMNQIIQITSKADNGCPSCVSSLWGQFYKQMSFPKDAFVKWASENDMDHLIENFEYEIERK